MSLNRIAKDGAAFFDAGTRLLVRIGRMATSRAVLVALCLWTALIAQELLTNEKIVKLTKAGLGDDVIVGMVNSQAGVFTTDSDSVISLKRAGVSNKVISAMVAKGGTGGPAEAPHASFAAPVSREPIILHDATPIRLRLTTNLSSADAKAGDRVDFEVVEEVKIDDTVVIKRGAMASGSVLDAEQKKRMGRGGKLDVALDSVRLVDDEKITLRGTRDSKGGGHTGAMTGAMVATAVVAWPAAPLFLLMHGKDTVLPRGTEITAYTEGEISLDPRKFVPRIR